MRLIHFICPTSNWSSFILHLAHNFFSDDSESDGDDSQEHAEGSVSEEDIEGNNKPHSNEATDNDSDVSDEE